jgi:hypothetical protein
MPDTSRTASNRRVLRPLVHADAWSCPYCGWDTRVLTTRRPKRRRQCLNPACKRRYNTREVIDAT